MGYISWRQLEDDIDSIKQSITALAVRVKAFEDSQKPAPPPPAPPKASSTSKK
jgi:hypothetical protein